MIAEFEFNARSESVFSRYHTARLEFRLPEYVGDEATRRCFESRSEHDYLRQASKRVVTAKSSQNAILAHLLIDFTIKRFKNRV